MALRFAAAFSHLPVRRMTSPVILSVHHYTVHRDGQADPKMAMLHDNPLQIDNIDIFTAAINGVSPLSMVKNALNVQGNTLLIQNEKFRLSKNVTIFAFGKAVLGMVRAVEDVLGDHIVGGIASIPTGLQNTLASANRGDLMPRSSLVTVYEGAENNIPDENAQRAAMAVYDRAKCLTEKDLCITLISGGGSALLPAVIPPLTLEDMAQVTKALSRAGATIQQLNTVRKNLELLKGGGLAATVQPAKVISLILSDVIGNPLDQIASGPTYRDNTNPQQCLDLFRILKVENQIPPSVKQFLEKAMAEREIGKLSSLPEFLEEEKSIPANDTSNALNLIVGSNEVLMEHAKLEAEKMGYLTYVFSTSLGGTASVVGEMFADLAAFICLTMGNKRRRDMQHSLVQEEMDLLRKGLSKDTVNEILLVAEQAANQDKPLCLLSAGETVVKVSGSGKGGRNQHLGLSAGIHLYDNASKYDLNPRFNIQLLSAGTDGQDGPTDATGAMVDSFTYLVGLDKGYDAKDYLANDDSYNYFSHVNGGRNLLKTGLTGTNVMDMQILLIKPTPKNSISDMLM